MKKTNKNTKITYETFELFRRELTKYALNLNKNYIGNLVADTTIHHFIYHKDIAKDIVQDVYLIFHEKIDKRYKFDSLNHVYNFLKKSVYWRSKDRHNINRIEVQERKSRYSLDIRDLPDSAHPEYIMIDDIHNKDLINNIISKISEKKKKVIKYSLDGYTPKEISKKLNVKSNRIYEIFKEVRLKIS